jgi:ubiquinone/menaquinone biosynthesis C-methylase UbiE
MSFYDRRILPHVINLAMSNRELLPYRERVLSAARGRVLEIGIGSGLNLPFYGANVEEILGLDPATRLIAMARRAANRSKTAVTFIAGSAEAIPIADRSVDTVLTTWTLCSIPNAVGALREMRRVLKPGGQLLFVEHGLAPEENVRKWQHRLTPIWKRIGGGCHLDRPIGALVESAGFRITRLDTGYMKGPRPMTFLYEGRAAPHGNEGSQFIRR